MPSTDRASKMSTKIVKKYWPQKLLITVFTSQMSTFLMKSIVNRTVFYLPNTFWSPWRRLPNAIQFCRTYVIVFSVSLTPFWRMEWSFQFEVCRTVGSTLVNSCGILIVHVVLSCVFYRYVSSRRRTRRRCTRWSTWTRTWSSRRTPCVTSSGR